MEDSARGRRPSAAIGVLLGAGAAGVAVAGAAARARRRRRSGRAGSGPGAANGTGPLLREDFPEAAEAIRALREAGMSVAVAESCTGGLCGAALTAIPGSSSVMVGGVIAYSDRVKSELLGVPGELIEREGAVSEALAAAMAEGARRRVGADVGIGITGVAGPAGDETGKPIGLIHVCVVTPQRTRRLRLTGDHGRESNRAGAVHAALQLCAEAGAVGAVPAP